MSMHDPASLPANRSESRYRCVAASVEGFIQQVAVSYIRTGHFFYVSANLKPSLDPAAVDAKLIRKYGVDVSRWGRALRKERGEANLQYIRHGRFFLLMATHGKSLFYELEGSQVRDCRRMPIKFAGYSLSYRGGHPHVRIDLETYMGFKAEMVAEGLRLDREGMEELLRTSEFVPYAPVRRQLWNVWREVNRARSTAGLEPLGDDCIDLRRRIVRPFGDAVRVPEPDGESMEQAAGGYHVTEENVGEHSLQERETPEPQSVLEEDSMGNEAAEDNTGDGGSSGADQLFHTLTVPSRSSVGRIMSGPSGPPVSSAPSEDTCKAAQKFTFPANWGAGSTEVQPDPPRPSAGAPGNLNSLGSATMPNNGREPRQ